MNVLEPNIQYDFSAEFLGFLNIEHGGHYQFRIVSDDGVCLALDGTILIDANVERASEATDGELYLEEDPHQLDVRYFQSKGSKSRRLLWKSGTQDEWFVVPKSYFLLPSL